MISEWSCDTEDWSNDHGKLSYDITGINYILKYIHLEKVFQLYQYSTILLFLLCFWSNKCILSEHKRLKIESNLHGKEMLTSLAVLF